MHTYISTTDYIGIAYIVYRIFYRPHFSVEPCSLTMVQMAVMLSEDDVTAS